MTTKVVHAQPTISPADPAHGGSTDDSNIVIRTGGLSKSFGDVTALDGMDLSVPRGAIVGFLGPNGAGKTTAIKLLLGLSRPTSGHATIFGRDSVRDSLAIRQRVGYLAQDPRFYGHMTARQTLEFAARFFYRGPADAVRERVEETLDLVGLADRADRPVRGFSGGERQRLGIAQAQVNHPDLLILDEPAAALDPVGRRDVLEIMERLRRNTTIFYSTHILDDVERVSDRVAILDHGRLVADAPTEELLGGDVSFEVTVKGAGARALAALQLQPWTHSVTARSGPATTTLRVVAGDEATAEHQLLPAVLAAGEIITAFGRRQIRLEDAFFALVKGPVVDGPNQKETQKETES